MCPLSIPVARRLASPGGQAHGVVTREQLLRAGLSSTQIRYRLRTGELIRESRASTASLGELLVAPLAGDGLAVARDPAHDAPHGRPSEEGGLRPPYR
jgi:hypothetical protein